MTVKELKDILESIPDHFLVEVDVEWQIKPKGPYPYPYESQRVNPSGYDVAYSDGRFKLDVELRPENHNQ